MFIPLIINGVKVKYVRTILGYYIICLVGTKKRITLTSAQFFEIFPEVSRNVKMGCAEMDRTYAKSLFAAEEWRAR
jgi:hypothetical protein